MGDMPPIKVKKNALCFIMGYLVAMVIRVTLFLLVQFCICYIILSVTLTLTFDLFSIVCHTHCA